MTSSLPFVLVLRTPCSPQQSSVLFTLADFCSQWFPVICHDRFTLCCLKILFRRTSVLHEIIPHDAKKPWNWRKWQVRSSVETLTPLMLNRSSCATRSMMSRRLTLPLGSTFCPNPHRGLGFRIGPDQLSRDHCIFWGIHWRNLCLPSIRSWSSSFFCVLGHCNVKVGWDYLAINFFAPNKSFLVWTSIETI